MVKAYTSRVGYGPFPTELTDQLGELIQPAAQLMEIGFSAI